MCGTKYHVTSSLPRPPSGPPPPLRGSMLRDICGLPHASLCALTRGSRPTRVQSRHLGRYRRGSMACTGLLFRTTYATGCTAAPPHRHIGRVYMQRILLCLPSEVYCSCCWLQSMLCDRRLPSSMTCVSRRRTAVSLHDEQEGAHLLGVLAGLGVKGGAVGAVLVRLGSACGLESSAHNRSDKRVVGVWRLEEVVQREEDCV